MCSLSGLFLRLNEIRLEECSSVKAGLTKSARSAVHQDSFIPQYAY